MSKKIFVTLQNGKVFEGYSFGAEKEVIGELVFTTGMTGYIETLTDPSYYGQIVTQTFPLIGNYGMISADSESMHSYLTAYIVREYLKREGIPAVYGIDTRELTKTVREAGVMNAAITFKPFTDFAALKRYKIKDAVASVSSKEVKTLGGGEYTVVLYDFGAKSSPSPQTFPQKRRLKSQTASCSRTVPETLRRTWASSRRSKKSRARFPCSEFVWDISSSRLPWAERPAK